MAVDPKYPKEMNEQIAKQPPLSNRDRAIWICGALVFLLSAVGLTLLHIARAQATLDSEEAALAVQQSLDTLWCIPAPILLVTLGVYCLICLFRRDALFGLPGAVYEGSTHREVLGYPLFMELSDAPENVAKKLQKERRAWRDMIIILVVFLYLFTWSWNGRVVCDPDGSVRVYSGRGAVKAEYNAEQVERLALRISEPYSGRYDSQKYHELDFMIRFTDGRYFVFRMEERTGDALRYLCQITALKEQFGPEIVRVEDTELLDNLIWDQGWIGEAEELARSLFGS